MRAAVRRCARHDAPEKIEQYAGAHHQHNDKCALRIAGNGRDQASREQKQDQRIAKAQRKLSDQRASSVRNDRVRAKAAQACGRCGFAQPLLRGLEGLQHFRKLCRAPLLRCRRRGLNAGVGSERHSRREQSQATLRTMRTIGQRRAGMLIPINPAAPRLGYSTRSNVTCLTRNGHE
jgi:hypothetical protein